MLPSQAAKADEGGKLGVVNPHSDVPQVLWISV